jgi:NADPH:quinone reductase-like Zn-dependent oxidoreductase
LKENHLDVSFNPVAGATFKKDFKLLGASGKLILFGGSERSGKNWGIFSTLNFVFKMGFMLPIVLMMTSKGVIGVNMLKLGDHKPATLAKCLQEVIKLFHQGLLQPIEGTSFKASEIALAHGKLESGTSIGKISIDW